MDWHDPSAIEAWTKEKQERARTKAEAEHASPAPKPEPANVVPFRIARRASLPRFSETTIEEARLLAATEAPTTPGQLMLPLHDDEIIDSCPSWLLEMYRRAETIQRIRGPMPLSFAVMLGALVTIAISDRTGREVITQHSLDEVIRWCYPTGWNQRDWMESRLDQAPPRLRRAAELPRTGRGIPSVAGHRRGPAACLPPERDGVAAQAGARIRRLRDPHQLAAATGLPAVRAHDPRLSVGPRADGPISAQGVCAHATHPRARAERRRQAAAPRGWRNRPIGTPRTESVDKQGRASAWARRRSVPGHEELEIGSSRRAAGTRTATQGPRR